MNISIIVQSLIEITKDFRVGVNVNLTFRGFMIVIYKIRFLNNRSRQSGSDEFAERNITVMLLHSDVVSN